MWNGDCFTVNVMGDQNNNTSSDQNIYAFGMNGISDLSNPVANSVNTGALWAVAASWTFYNSSDGLQYFTLVAKVSGGSAMINSAILNGVGYF